MTKKEKMLERRSKVRPEWFLNKMYNHLLSRVNKILQEKVRTKDFFFWVYPEFLPENMLIKFKETEKYTIVYFSDIYIYEGIKERLKKDDIPLKIFDEYHCSCPSKSFKQP